jgi:hypothetical protein
MATKPKRVTRNALARSATDTSAGLVSGDVNTRPKHMLAPRLKPSAERPRYRRIERLARRELRPDQEAKLRREIVTALEAQVYRRTMTDAERLRSELVPSLVGHTLAVLKAPSAEARRLQDNLRIADGVISETIRLLYEKHELIIKGEADVSRIVWDIARKKIGERLGSTAYLYEDYPGSRQTRQPGPGMQEQKEKAIALATQMVALLEETPRLASTVRSHPQFQILAEFISSSGGVGSRPTPRTPELWAERKSNSGENAIAFLRRVHKPSHSGLILSDIRPIDPELATALNQWRRRGNIPDDLQSFFANTKTRRSGANVEKELKELNIRKPSDVFKVVKDPKERRRLYKAAQRRLSSHPS